MVMVMKTHDAGNQGLDEKQLYDGIYDDLLIKPRLAFLIEARLGYMDKNKYFLTSRGMLYAKVFLAFRNFLKLDQHSSG